MSNEGQTEVHALTADIQDNLVDAPRREAGASTTTSGPSSMERQVDFLGALKEVPQRLKDKHSIGRFPGPQDVPGVGTGATTPPTA